MLFARSIPSTGLLVVLTAFVVAGCGRTDDVPLATPVAPAQAGEEAGSQDVTGEDGQDDGFDLSGLPVSTVTLGEFPYLALPDEYRTTDASTFDLERVPFWTGESFHWVEGRVHQAAIFADTGKTFSELELRTYMDEMLDRVGAVLVSEVPEVPVHVASQNGLDEAVRMKYRAGLGHFYSQPVRTYIIRRADGDVWVHFSSHERGANWIIAKSAHYDPTIRLLSGVELKRLIDADGRALIHLNFGSGDAIVQDDSVPQLEQIALLLSRDPELSLAINGHADSQGSAERNMALSLERAEAVVDALRQHGIAGDRLSAEGFGDTAPVADNASVEGRARNRRVELVRR